MVTFDEKLSREVRAHPLYKAAVKIQIERITPKPGRPRFSGVNPNDLIEQLVGYKTVTEIEALAETSGRAIQERASRGCLMCNGTATRMVGRRRQRVKPMSPVSVIKYVPKRCDLCALHPDEMWVRLLKRHPDLAKQYSYELQLWGVVAAMVADEAMAEVKKTQPPGFGLQEKFGKRRKANVDQ
jgi:hypothetical protein